MKERQKTIPSWMKNPKIYKWTILIVTTIFVVFITLLFLENYVLAENVTILVAALIYAVMVIMVQILSTIAILAYQRFLACWAKKIGKVKTKEGG